MVDLDEDALICDFAEFYGIYDYTQLDPSYAAILAIGLRGTSRIKMKMAGLEYDLKEILLAGCLDKLSYLFWAQTKDGFEGKNHPKSVLAVLSGTDQSEKQTTSFKTGEDFMTEWNRLAKG